MIPAPAILPEKKDRVVTLRISEDDFNVVENFARAKGLSVSAYINSVINLKQNILSILFI